jgi:hypothetical protein
MDSARRVTRLLMKQIRPRARTLTSLLGFLGLASLLVAKAADSNAAAAPPIVNPGPPPSDAVVLFDGKDLSKWRGENGAARWDLKDGTMVVNGTGSLISKETFGDCQLHLEWAAPEEVQDEGQGRGNSGVYLLGRYEIQVLDSYNNPTYPDGQAGAFYGHAAPLVNVARKPGEWQTYDIIFHAPRTAADGTIKPGSFTVLHNGVLVQDRVPIPGEPTTAAQFRGVAAEGPLVLQDHGNPVRFRNIWIRRL